MRGIKLGIVPGKTPDAEAGAHQGKVERMIYRDRSDAGRQLAQWLEPYHGRETLVLGLPRGGVEVAYEIAETLEAELDVLVVRKLGAPQNPELGIGAIASCGARFLNEPLVKSLRISPGTIEQIERREWNELQRREKAYRGDGPPPLVEGRAVILVDDGLATGGTAQAAIQALRGLKPKMLVLAVPVGPLEAVRALRAEVDELVCPLIPPLFQAVGEWYARFNQTSDEKVVELLSAHRAHLAAGKAE